MDPEPEEVAVPNNVVTEELVKQALLADKGKEAQLRSWEVVPFTKKGDNYICLVTSVVVKYAIDFLELETSYVVKQAPKGLAQIMKNIQNVIFEKEAKFYLELLPQLNAVAESVGQPPLCYARCFHYSSEMGQEQIYFEDLRRKGFKMFNRRKGMDVPHATLVLRELARLHATSLLLQAKYPNPIEERHQYLAKDFFTYCDGAKEYMMPLLQNALYTGIEMLDRIGGYDRSKAWIESLKPEVEDIFSDQLKNHKYDVFCHGDCWTNNILFR